MPDTHQGQGFLAWRRHHSLPPGTPCANCGTVLQGPWCHACGQSGFDFHRHASHMIGETIESFFHADGRLWRTLGRLIVQPARLTCDYLAGKRAPQIPPLRLFLVAVFLVFVVSEHTGRIVKFDRGAFHFDQLSPEDKKDVEGARSAVLGAHVQGLGTSADATMTDWLRVHLGRAADHPEELARAMRERAETFAVFMLPISALILAALFVRRRGVVLFDHLVFTMHSLSFAALLFTTATLLRSVTSPSAWLLLLAAPVHLFAHMRGTYRTGVAGTLLRMSLLFVLSSLGFTLLLLALLGVGLATLGG